MALPWLILQEWISQWLGMRDRLSRGEAGPDSWWLNIRERILRFLLSRYIENDEATSPPPLPMRPPPLPMEARRTYCRVKAEDHPPRTCSDMAGRLRSVHAINKHKRARWRFL
jgi:hypothetical protein